jgi:ferric-dicitrate binding protein FerR (iron transport regulator)
VARVALSDEEQKLLEQMEAALAAEDPKLAHTLRGTKTPRTLQRKRAAIAGLAFVAGCAMLVAGMRAHWAISVVGFVIMLASTVIAVTAYRRVEPNQAGPSKVQAGQRTGASDGSFMDKIEERWRRRQDEGL